ncbi:MAG: NDP-sugar synthase [Candidatus Margulisiibacteriota bacterium]
MKAFIMAAGYGTRLEPLTIAVPKPMVPIVNIPTMQHNVELLKQHGLKEIVANIHYHPEQIENFFGDGNMFGVSLTYSYEEELLGTAGGVKRMASKIAKVNDTFLVLSSDALTDINLGRLIAYHKEKKALVTMALCEMEDVSQFGVVERDEEGKILAFQEKPRPEEARSKFVNTGIYVMEPAILDLIPKGHYDFGKQLFPELVANKSEIYGYQMVEYWSDVGSLEQYIQACYVAMRGGVRIRVPGKKQAASTWIGAREAIAKSARFDGAVVIGDRCTIGNNVYIKNSVIGDKCVIEDGTQVVGSVLWSDTFVGKEASINKSIIGSWCSIGDKAKIDDSVLSNRCVIRNNVIVPPLSRLKPNSIL